MATAENVVTYVRMQGVEEAMDRLLRAKLDALRFDATATATPPSFFAQSSLLAVVDHFIVR
jgi:hypothetical protein